MPVSNTAVESFSDVVQDTSSANIPLLSANGAVFTGKVSYNGADQSDYFAIDIVGGSHDNGSASLGTTGRMVLSYSVDPGGTLFIEDDPTYTYDQLNSGNFGFLGGIRSLTGTGTLNYSNTRWTYTDPGDNAYLFKVSVRTGGFSGQYNLSFNNFTETGQGAPCFCTGTLIRTDRGEVAVEDLRVGDEVVTSSGALRPVIWIGYRTVRCDGRKDLLPVRVSKDAFGPNRPARDLVVSPGHALCVDLLGEVLIPACRLLNGTTITQVAADTVTYWHVELDSHDIVLAEGMPAESYLDCGNRRFFANADATDLHVRPDARSGDSLPFCRPFHEAGALVDVVRARLGDRAAILGWRLVEDRFAGMHLIVDGQVIDAKVDGLIAHFVVPAGARDVRLVSETSVPAHVLPGSTDDRRLGLPVMGLAINGAPITIDDPRLCEGWYGADEGTRWTAGAAVLPAALWEGHQGTVTLRVDLSVPALPRWVASGDETAAMAA